MIEITDEERNTPLKRGDLVDFLAALERAFDNAPPLVTPRIGDVVPQREVLSLNSDALAECDGARVRLWGLTNGRTGCQIGDDPIRYCN